MFWKIQRIRLKRSLHRYIGRDSEGTPVLSEVFCRWLYIGSKLIFLNFFFKSHCSLETQGRLPRVNQWGTIKANYFLTLFIFILSFDIGVSMGHIVIPLSMTVSCWDFAMEKNHWHSVWIYSLWNSFCLHFWEKDHKKEWNDSLFLWEFQSIINIYIQGSNIATKITSNKKKRGQVHAIFFLSCLLQHHDHYCTKAVKSDGPKIWSGMQILNSKRLCPFSSK